MCDTVPGVYNYCDRWCERCAKQSVCAVYANPAFQLASQYASVVWEITRKLGDAPFTDSVDAMAWDSARTLSWTITAKTARAIHEIIDIQHGDDCVDRTRDPRGIQSDGHGSAKVTRLMIRESRDAWIALARHDGPRGSLAGQMIRLLDALDRELVLAFPHAMDFVRPGFDE